MLDYSDENRLNATQEKWCGREDIVSRRSVLFPFSALLQSYRCRHRREQLSRQVAGSDPCRLQRPHQRLLFGFPPFIHSFLSRDLPLSSFQQILYQQQHHDHELYLVTPEVA